MCTLCTQLLNLPGHNFEEGLWQDRVRGTLCTVCSQQQVCVTHCIICVQRLSTGLVRHLMLWSQTESIPPSIFRLQHCLGPVLCTNCVKPLGMWTMEKVCTHRCAQDWGVNCSRVPLGYGGEWLTSGAPRFTFTGMCTRLLTCVHIFLCRFNSGDSPNLGSLRK